MTLKSNTPGSKRLNQKARLCKAKEWIHTYTGKSIIKGYAKWFGVDWICALDELKFSGVLISDEEEKKIVLGYNQRIQQRRSEKESIHIHERNFSRLLMPFRKSAVFVKLYTLCTKDPL